MHGLHALEHAPAPACALGDRTSRLPLSTVGPTLFTVYSAPPTSPHPRTRRVGERCRTTRLIRSGRHRPTRMKRSRSGRRMLSPQPGAGSSGASANLHNQSQAQVLRVMKRGAGKNRSQTTTPAGDRQRRLAYATRETGDRQLRPRVQSLAPIKSFAARAASSAGSSTRPGFVVTTQSLTSIGQESNLHQGCRRWKTCSKQP